MADLFYRNPAGNMVNLNKLTPTNPGFRCNYNCNNTSNPADLHLVYTVNYVQRFYTCESGEKSHLNANWVISVPYTPLVSLSGNYSTGTVKITSPSSSVLTLTTNPANNEFIVIRNLGADPSCSANSLYEISYTVKNVPNSYFGSGMLIEASLSLYNDCALLGNLVATGFSDSPDYTLVADQPCKRVDKVYINPNLGPSNCATATGNYTICSYPSGFTPIDYHQLEYRLVNSGSGSLQWNDQTSVVYWGRIPFTSTDWPTLAPSGGVLNLINMVPSSGTWLTRYRNVKTGTCDIINPGPSGPPDGNWGSEFYWVTEVWVL